MDEQKFSKYIFLTKYGDSLAVAWHLQKKGKTVLVGMVDDLTRAESKEKEDREDKRRRFSVYSGILNKQKAETLIEKMRSFPNKEEWFVVIDFNTMWSFAQEALKMGFTNGLFPSKFDFKLESDREMGKAFVEKFYTGIEVAPHEDFKTIDEGIEYISQSENFLALKSNDPEGATVVPTDKNIEFAKQNLIDALNYHKEKYERKGFTLENQIRDGVEYCAETIFYNGEIAATSVDIENKAIGDENTARMTGCMQNLICATEEDAEVNVLARPEAMNKLAKKHKGMFFSDLNTIYKDGKFYYLEHCGNRPGYDALVTEIEMSDGADLFFDKISQGENPFLRKFGYAVRGLNLNQDKDYLFKEGLNMRWKPEDEDHIFPFEMMKEDDRMVCTGTGVDLVVFTGSSDDMEYAIKKAHDVCDNFSFKEMYYRSRQDSMSREYSTAILSRYDAIQSKLQCKEDEEVESDD